MATVTLRQIKGSALTNTELDLNFTNINAETVDNSSVYTLRPSLNLDLVGSKTVSPLISFDRNSIGTYFDSDGLLKTAGVNVPRFNYDPISGELKGLLIEDSRTNLLIDSNIPQSQTVSVSATSYVLSFYDTGTITLSGASNGVFVGNGAFPVRTSILITPTTGNLIISITGTISFIQLEQGSTATSYIPTTSAPVTRLADNLTINKSSNWFTSVNGTLALSHDSVSGQPILGDGSNTLLTSLGAGITNIDYTNSQLPVVTQTGQTPNTQGIFNFDSDLYILGNSIAKANAHIKYLKFYTNNVIGSMPAGSGFILDDGYALLQEDGSVIFQE